MFPEAVILPFAFINGELRLIDPEGKPPPAFIIILPPSPAPDPFPVWRVILPPF